MAIDTDVRATTSGRRRTWRAGAPVGLALMVLAPTLSMAVVPTSTWAKPGAPEANEVVGYAAADRSGETRSWTLPDDTPYLFVPYVDAEAAGSVAAVETGANVGAVLFQRPYFETRDAGCAPEMGSDARPDLRWRGATARFSPPVDGGPISPDGAPASTKTERFASLIVYRKDVGPPPGALLLNRRLTLGTSCRKAVHKTFFNRVFVPLAAPPAPARCYNLSGTYARDGGKDINVDFAFADRVALLQPADLDDRYRDLRHRFRVILFDGEGCRGRGGEFRSEGKKPGTIKLSPIGLRDRVRSVRVVYEGGPLAPYYAVPKPVPVAEVPVAEVPVAEAPKAEVPLAEVPVAEKPPQPTAPEADIAARTTAGTTKDTATPPPSQPAATTRDSVVAKATPAPAPASTLIPAPKERDEPAVARAPTAAVSLYAALPAPRLKLLSTTPESLTPTPKPTAASKTFEYPVQDIYRLNFCLRWGVDCGEPAATAWCKAQGFARASTWKIDKDIGSLFPTIVMADKRVCAEFPCDGFEEITCINEGPAPRPIRQSTTNG